MQFAVDLDDRDDAGSHSELASQLLEGLVELTICEDPRTEWLPLWQRSVTEPTQRLAEQPSQFGVTGPESGGSFAVPTARGADL